MRWISCLLWALLATPAAAQTGVQVTRITITSSGLQPVDSETSIFYPAKTVFRVALAGLVPGRPYTARMFMQDGSPNILAERNWTFVPTEPDASVSLDVETYRGHTPGDWKFTLHIDRLRVAERIMHASRRPPPPPVAEYPPLTLVRAMVTESLSRNKEPRRPLDTLKLPSAVYYYVEAKGFLPNQNYQVRVLVLDGANKMVGDHQFGTTPRQEQHIQWFPIIPRETHAPGLWTFRMYFGRAAPASQLVAETRIEASAQGGQARTARLERFAPAVAIAVVALLAYIAYNMVVFGRTPVGAAQAAPGGATAQPGGGVARALLDPSLAALIAVNLLPLGLALFAGANAADILFLYWVENLVIALYTLLRMVAARGLGAKHTSPLLFIPFFILHFGMFCTAHLGILLQYMWEHSNLFALNAHGMLNPRTAAEFDRAARDLWDVVPFAFVLQVSLLLISHGLSFVHNYLKGGEYLLAEPRTEMMRPYYRVGIMHVAAIATGFVAMAQGSPLVMLVILVLLKTGLDAYLHLRSHLPHLPPLTSPQ